MDCILKVLVCPALLHSSSSDDCSKHLQKLFMLQEEQHDGNTSLMFCSNLFPVHEVANLKLQSMKTSELEFCDVIDCTIRFVDEQWTIYLDTSSNVI